VAMISKPYLCLFLSKDIRLSLDHRAIKRNLNVLVIGGPGANKTQGFVLPNICQLSFNLLITDPKG